MPSASLAAGSVRAAIERIGLEEIMQSAAIARLRAMVKKAAPRAKETMEHGMPTYFQGGEPVFAVASFRLDAVDSILGEAMARLRERAKGPP